ncbi:cilia- and flagella-associated protein HOATZ isoform X2 [Nematostella vectensis]|uniref:cilia- and flagella-associated protein HOATZ isoform X2 n=1 Tax=Nematostella vectensis TaxID=45351 RepID=UPI002076DC19|nr:cilia- and flagella-associated protein HOATZ isoform X2 [Nematostella vectensis]
MLLATKNMADEGIVTFSGSSAEDIENAKAFWRARDPELKPKSALFVTGLDHRLKTAPAPKTEKNYAHLTRDQLQEPEINPGLKRFQEDAEKQGMTEEFEYTSRVNYFRNESKQRLEQRRKERIKKEEVSSKVIQRAQEPLIEISDSSDDDDDARQAMDDIEKFEARMRQQEVYKPS